MQCSLRNEVLFLKCATSFVTSVTHQCASQEKLAHLLKEATEAEQAIWNLLHPVLQSNIYYIHL